MRHLTAAFLVFLSLFATAPAYADFDQSKSWFDALPQEERSEMQANLTLLGHYTFLVDGQFGNGTYQALTAFQRTQGRAATGVLIPRDRDRLIQMAAQVYDELGMDLVRDEAGQAALIMPVGLLTVTKGTSRGSSYATPDGGISLETIRRPSGEQSFADLFAELKSPGGGRFITYSNYNNDRFVVSGKANGRQFYTMFQNAETDSVGYSLSWTEANAERANMLAIFIASHFSALRYMPAEADQVKLAETPSVTQKFGVFTLPVNDPNVIYMNGEVTHTLAADFYRAIEARPNARVMVLNSPGGYVDNALQVAHEVRKRGITTLVGEGMGCYSACAYIFFAGPQRYAQGELGVHQISAEVADLVLAQTTLADVLDALDEFGVEQHIITVMLQTPPEDMYVFKVTELSELGINIGEPVRVADISTITVTNVPANDTQVAPLDTPKQPDTPSTGGTAYVQLSITSSPEEAERSLRHARERWAGVLGDAIPEIDRDDRASGTVYHVRVPARSVESANALCAAIKSAGGGCYVTDA
jgi:peptidoglycan hydrolase-like protein with peptidoglycan-binding domain/ATP-dependent protease ClpP protease subunit